MESIEQGVLYEDKSRRIQFANNAFCELFSIPSPDLLSGLDCEIAGQSSKLVFVNPELWIERVNVILEARKVVIGEELLLTDGKVYERDYIPVIINDIQEGNYWIYRNITERKKNESKLKQMLEDISEHKEIIELNLSQKNALVNELTQIKEKLELVNSEKDKFFSIIAHDLRSPFSGFLGLTQIISEQFQDLSMNDLMEMGKSMQDSATNLYKLLENLLEWAKMQRGISEFYPSEISLNMLINKNVKVNTPKLELKNISCELNVCDNLLVLGDERMLDALFRNLISNAIKFTNRDGKISISSLQENEEIIVCVADNGIGMTEDMIGKLFKLGEKTNRVGTEDESSSGLGLLLCNEYINKHNGKIWVESEVGVGSKFYFNLPALSANTIIPL